MKSVLLSSSGSIDNLLVQDAVVRPPVEDEIRVRVCASSINFHDLSVVLGRLGHKENLVPLSDGAGVVEEVGKNVTEFQPGDHVISCFCPDWSDGEPTPVKINPGVVAGDGCDGFATQMVTMHQRYFTKAPMNLSFAEAATLPCAALTAWHAVFEEQPVVPGDVVLVQGTGGVATFALQFAKMAGCRVIATSSCDEKLKKMEALGADELINYRQTPEWGKRAMELTGGKGVQAVIEVGGANTLEQSLIAVEQNGYIAVIGVLTGREAAMPLVLAFAKSVSIKGISVGSRQHQLRMIKAIETNGLHPAIGQTFGLEELPQAIELMRQSGHFGKICLSH